jgi:hypothetical protein
MVGVFYSAKTRFQARGEIEYLLVGALKNTYSTIFELEFSTDQIFYFALWGFLLDNKCQTYFFFCIL